jgi:hypothetical protein
MEGLNVVDILKVGLPGLVFLLSMLTFQLITKVARGGHLDRSLVTTIRTFMYVNVALAVLTLAAPVLDYLLVPAPTDKVFTAEAGAGSHNMELGTAVVCANAAYNGHYLLVSSDDRSALIQVFARSVMPCPKPDQIELSDMDLRRLRLQPGAAAGTVQVVVAGPGQKFVMDDMDPAVAGAGALQPPVEVAEVAAGHAP